MHAIKAETMYKQYRAAAGTQLAHILLYPGLATPRPHPVAVPVPPYTCTYTPLSTNTYMQRGTIQDTQLHGCLSSFTSTQSCHDCMQPVALPAHSVEKELVAVPAPYLHQPVVEQAAVLYLHSHSQVLCIQPTIQHASQLLLES